MDNNIEISIRSLPIWKNKIDIKTIEGGITNQNFLVQDKSKKFFVRLGNDIPEHNVSRSNELMANKAAFEAGVSPMEEVFLKKSSFFGKDGKNTALATAFWEFHINQYIETKF